MPGGENPDQQRDAEDAGQRYGIGQIHKNIGAFGRDSRGFAASCDYPPPSTVNAMNVWTMFANRWRQYLMGRLVLAMLLLLFGPSFEFLL